MTEAHEEAQQAEWGRWRATAELYHACFTGLVLMVVTRRGTPQASEFVFRVFRRQQQERFLPGLRKLGIANLPPAVAAAQYHYLSNWIGGVHVEYIYESDRKAWVRYPPPRWIWKGTATAACRAKSLGRCCADGTPTTGRRSEIRGSVLFAPSRAWMVRMVLRAITSNTTTRSSRSSASC